MPQLPIRLARRALRALPPRWVERIRAARVQQSYRLHAAGIVPDAEAESWFFRHGRPVSIVIPSYNDIPLLTEAVASIRRTCVDVDYEIIVVDDFIDDAVQAQLRAMEAADLRVILKDERLGFAGTVNIGMEAAQHDIILLNSDVVAQPGWLPALQRAAYTGDPSVGLVSPKLLYPDGRIQYGGTYYARLLAPQWFGHLHVGSAAGKPTANVPGYNTSISGACVYITREAFERVGLLDEGFWLGFEDVDYGLRAWQRGVRCYYEPRSTLVHHEAASRGYSQGRRELASMRRFWRRWESRLLSRAVDASRPVAFVVSERSDALWRAYVESAAAELRRRGRSARLVECPSGGADDEIVTALGEAGVVVACDWGAAETVWLAAAEGACAPAYLLPEMETIAHPHDPSTQARILAGYRSEFDYISPNAWTASQLRAETAWPTRSVVAPALPPAPLEEEATQTIVVITGRAEHSALHDAIRGVARTHGYEIHEQEEPRTPEAIAAIAKRSPRAVVCLTEQQSSLLPLALMSLGAAYLAPTDPRLSHEVLDGYNSLLFPAGDAQALARSLTDAIETDDDWRELRENGRSFAERTAQRAVDAIARTIEDISARPF